VSQIAKGTKIGTTKNVTAPVKWQKAASSRLPSLTRGCLTSSTSNWTGRGFGADVFVEARTMVVRQRVQGTRWRAQVSGTVSVCLQAGQVTGIGTVSLLITQAWSA